jgi:ATP-dependent RNA helicase DeaD
MEMAERVKKFEHFVLSSAMRRGKMKKNSRFGSYSDSTSRPFYGKRRSHPGRRGAEQDGDFQGFEREKEPEVEAAPLPSYAELGEQLAMNPLVLQSIKEMGFETPSPIQAQALPILLGESTDFLGLAATGTGKTAAFAIPLLHKIDTRVRGVQALVLCPTRELAIQVAGQIDLLGKHLGVQAVPVYGGASYGDQIRGIKRGSAIVVGTPGRVQDHIDQGTLSLDQVNLVVLDEADEMISMGFKESIESILSSVSEEASNIWLFSATMSREVREVADEFLESPKSIEVNRKEMLPESIEQLYYITQESNKPEVLCKLIDAADDFYGLIFCQTKALVTDVTMYLQGRGYRVDCLHGDKDQNERERTMQAFRDRKVTILVCTDVASRGIDVKDVTHVINFSIPRELDSYVHRIGRTARSGKKGYAMSLITASGRGLISRIERMTKRRMIEGKIPTRKEIGKKKVDHFLKKFQSELAHSRALELMSDAWREALKDMSAEDVASRFVALSFPEIFAERAETSPAQPLGVRGDRGARRNDGPVKPLAPSGSGMVIKTVDKNEPAADVAPQKKFQSTLELPPLDDEHESEEAIESFFSKGEAEAPAPSAQPAKKFFKKREFDGNFFEKRGFQKQDFDKRSSERRDFGRSEFGGNKREFGKREFGGRDFGSRDFGSRDSGSFGRSEAPRRESRFAPNPFGNNSAPAPRYRSGEGEGRGPMKWATKKGKPGLNPNR